MQSVKALAKRHLPASLKAMLYKRATPVSVVRASPGSWVSRHLTSGGAVPHPKTRDDLASEIERRARLTEARGSQPLWTGFNQDGATRTSEQVRTNAVIGRFFTYAALTRRPSLVVEFGTAFGLSGMYWLAGLQANGHGRMLTFEPNELWAGIANENLRAIGNRYTLTVGTFEDNLSVVDGGIEIAFIDAIHTSAFVLPQLALVRERAAPGALIFLDDIGFSDDMRDCWRRVSSDPSYAAVATVGNVGVVELQ